MLVAVYSRSGVSKSGLQSAASMQTLYSCMAEEHCCVPTPSHSTNLGSAKACMTLGPTLCRHREDEQVWAGLCDAWDSALLILGKAQALPQPLSFRSLMDGHIAHHLLKPVRAR